MYTNLGLSIRSRENIENSSVLSFQANGAGSHARPQSDTASRQYLMRSRIATGLLRWKRTEGRHPEWLDDSVAWPTIVLKVTNRLMTGANH